MSWKRRMRALTLGVGGMVVLLPLALPPSVASSRGEGVENGASGQDLLQPGETHFRDLTQLTFGGENAEGYWSPDGRRLVFQATRPPFACDQIFLLDLANPLAPALVSTGKGRTTCGYFLADGQRVLYSSTHLAGSHCPPPPDRSRGYVWPLYDTYEIFTANPDGSDPLRLTHNSGYDAEATVCPRDGSIVFTSSRDGDLELYRMDAEGRNVRRLTQTPGYDGGAFFSPDCSRIVWRASRPQGEELEDYQRLLAQGLVRPGKLEIWVANADGSDARQVTYLGVASFAPSFFPSGERIIFSSNYGDPRGREFELWAINVDGTQLERLTWSPGFDGFPHFSPDGTRLAFASNRNQSRPGETNLFVAAWVDHPPRFEPRPADRFAQAVRWLADDAREGRGLGTRGLEEAADWIEERFRELGLEPAGDGGTYRQAFQVPVAVRMGPGTRLVFDGREIPEGEFRIASFSAPGGVTASVVTAGYGITAPELGWDDYRDLDAKGKVVLVRRFVPRGEPFHDAQAQRRWSALRYKAFNAREHGAAALLVVDLPVVGEGEELPQEAPLPHLDVDPLGDAGLPVLFVTRAAAAPFLDREALVELTVDLEVERAPTVNLIGRIRPGGGQAFPGALVIGAHYDHLGMGGRDSLAPGVEEPHNGADDNASGVAALLEAARELVQRREELQREVWFVAFSGEESGLLGSTHFTRKPPAGLELGHVVAMVNLDMVGRLRENRLSVLGGESAEEWDEILHPLCLELGLICKLGGDGFGPSDQTPFYASGIPVLHFFTGIHSDYHRPSDDPEHIHAIGGARVAALVARVAEVLTRRPEGLTYRQVSSPLPVGDVRATGASLGTIPDYTGDPQGRPGLLLAGVRPGGPAETAGLRRGDLLVELGGHEIRNIYDLMFVLQQAKPGQAAKAVILREGQRLTLEVVFGERRER